MSTIGRTFALVFGAWLAYGPAPAAAAQPAAPAVVVSIGPVHSLVAAVMGDIGEPTLLVKGAASPHTASLRPSEAAALQRADLVFWIGEELETFLVKPLSALPARAQVVPLAATPGITLLPARLGGPWGEHGHDHGHDHDDAPDHGAEDHDASHVDEAPADMHLWLDPENAKAVAAAAAAALAKADPARAGIYAGNLEALRQRLDALDHELRATLAPVTDQPYVVFHDAYQYFEARYGLSPAGAVTVSPERAPGARTLAAVRDRIKASGAVCVFREPQFEPDLIETLVSGSLGRVGVLDPLGADIAPGADAYPALMRRLATSLRACLGA